MTDKKQITPAGFTDPATFVPFAEATSDPALVAVERYRALSAESTRLYGELDEAQREAVKTHGRRPFALIPWRHYGAIGGSEIDHARDQFLSEPDANAEAIEQEYQDAKQRERDAERAGAEWDRQTGLDVLRQRYESVRAAEIEAGERMARTEPTTPAGAAALIAVVKEELDDCGGISTDWELTALETAAVALQRPGVFLPGTDAELLELGSAWAAAHAAIEAAGNVEDDAKREKARTGPRKTMLAAEEQISVTPALTIGGMAVKARIVRDLADMHPFPMAQSLADDVLRVGPAEGGTDAELLAMRPAYDEAVAAVAARNAYAETVPVDEWTREQDEASQAIFERLNDVEGDILDATPQTIAGLLFKAHVVHGTAKVESPRDIFQYGRASLAEDLLRLLGETPLHRLPSWSEVVAKANAESEIDEAAFRPERERRDREFSANYALIKLGRDYLAAQNAPDALTPEGTERLTAIERQIIEATPYDAAGLAVHALPLRDHAAEWWNDPEAFAGLPWALKLAKWLVDRALVFVDAGEPRPDGTEEPGR
jgi:hypothetical protein